MKKEDRNTAIIVIIVLVVCTISLVAIGSTLWNIVSPAVNAALSFVGLNVRLVTVDYNFQFPRKQVAISSASSLNPQSSSESSTTASFGTPEVRVVPANYTYNFDVPKAAGNAPIDATGIGLRDAILTDAQLAGYGSGTDTPQTQLLINIPKIKVNSPVFQGLGGDDLLDRGFWVYPTSKPIGQGELILLCHRRYFGPYDPRSCWNLDKMAAGDEIFIKGSNNQDVKFQVIGVNEFAGNSANIYTISDTEKYLKIVTCHPLYSDQNRLVVLAKMVE